MLLFQISKQHQAATLLFQQPHNPQPPFPPAIASATPGRNPGTSDSKSLKRLVILSFCTRQTSQAMSVPCP